jgi:hypothetical protein
MMLSKVSRIALSKILESEELRGSRLSEKSLGRMVPRREWISRAWWSSSMDGFLNLSIAFLLDPC